MHDKLKNMLNKEMTKTVYLHYKLHGILGTSLCCWAVRQDNDMSCILSTLCLFSLTLTFHNIISVRFSWYCNPSILSTLLFQLASPTHFQVGTFHISLLLSTTLSLSLTVSDSVGSVITEKRRCIIDAWTQR